jgi:hypothetical protein
MEMKLVEFVKETFPNYQKRLERGRDTAGKSAITDKILEWHPRSEFDFENIIPYPEEFIQQDKDYLALSKEEFDAKYPDDPGAHGGYHWRVKNWGAKWNASNSVYVPQRKTFYFDTAWGNCVPIIAALHKLFPTAWFSYEYYERGMGFMGGCEFVPEKYWDPADYTVGEAYSIEQRMKLLGSEIPRKWAAGDAYNPWYVEDYLGFKGG